MVGNTFPFSSVTDSNNSLPAYACIQNPKIGMPRMEDEHRSSQLADILLSCVMNGTEDSGQWGSHPRSSSFLHNAAQGAAAAAAASSRAARLANARAGVGAGTAGDAARLAAGAAAAAASESEEDDSDPDPDGKPVSDKSTGVAGTLTWDVPTNKKSGVWQFFLQGGEPSNKQQAKCQVDGCEKPIVKAQSTINLSQHMHAHHREFPPYVEYKGTNATAVKAAPKSPARTKSPSREGSTTSKIGIKRKKDDTGSALHSRLILGFIVGGYQSLDVVEEEQYRVMMRGFTNKPNMRIPCRKTMEMLVANTAIEAKGKLKEMVAGELLSLSCECWTSGRQMRMMGVTGHWIDKNWVLQSACLSVVELAGSDNGSR